MELNHSNIIYVVDYSKDEVNECVNNYGNKYCKNLFMPWLKNTVVDFTFSFSDIQEVQLFKFRDGSIMPDIKCPISYVYSIFQQPIKRLVLDMDKKNKLVVAHVEF